MKQEIPSAATRSADRRAQFLAAYRVLTDAIAAHAFPGCAFGVLAEGKVVLEDALGRFTYEEGAPGVAAETVFDVASITKVVATTAMAMLLWQRGQLDLEMPLGELLPGFVVGRSPGDRAREVTLRHLLTHSSGLPGYVEFFRTALTASALYSALLELPLEAEPGTRAEYSDPGFMLLGKALEVVAGESLATWAGREVFEPLGMGATGYCPPGIMRESIPPTEDDTLFRKRRIQGEVQDENACLLKGVAGHAGIFSNVPDLLRFSAAILKAGHPQDPAPASPRLFDAATVAHFAERQGPEGSSRALGWDTPSKGSSSGRCFSTRTIGHLGFSGCSLWIDLEAGVAVALLTNRTWPDRQAQSIREIRPAFHNAIREAL
jgi:CubicO group peptidase (beta-lactamase class C family)